MQVAARPYLAAGVALFGASASSSSDIAVIVAIVDHRLECGRRAQIPLARISELRSRSQRTWAHQLHQPHPISSPHEYRTDPSR